jgi:hypothetical protein
VNDDATATIEVMSGNIGLRKASAASKVALTDSTTLVYQNEVAELNTAGAVSSIRIGSLDSDGTAAGDPMTFSASSIVNPDIQRQIKIPWLNAALPRFGRTNTLVEMLFDTIGLRSNLASGVQTNQGVVPLRIENLSYFFTPVGDATVDMSRKNGVELTQDGMFEITRAGVMVRFRPSVFDTQGFATSFSLFQGGVVKLNSAGALEVSQGGNTLLMMPEMFTTRSADSSGSSGVFYDDDGFINYANGGLVQRMLPTLYDITQFSITFVSVADKIELQDNLNGTYTVSLHNAAEEAAEDGITEELIGTFTIVPNYTILSPLIVQNTHLNDSWWSDDDGLIYIKYSNGSAQGFRIY